MSVDLEQKLKNFKTWLRLKYEESELYDELAALHIWKEVKEKFSETFDE